MRTSHCHSQPLCAAALGMLAQIHQQTGCRSSESLLANRLCNTGPRTKPRRRKRATCLIGATGFSSLLSAQAGFQPQQAEPAPKLLMSHFGICRPPTGRHCWGSGLRGGLALPHCPQKRLPGGRGVSLPCFPHCYPYITCFLDSGLCSGHERIGPTAHLGMAKHSSLIR